MTAPEREKVQRESPLYERNLTMASAAGMSSQNEDLYTRIIDTLNAIFGSHPGYRAIHPKGIVCQGTFTPSAAAASLSRAAHFQAPVPVTVRFSDFAGVPTIPDTDPNASPRGLGLKFHLPGGVEADIVAHSFNGFPAATAEEFLEFLQALATSGPDAAHPSPIEKFLSTRPYALTFATAPKPAPASFATESYYAINAFAFVSKDGTRRFIRYEVHPVDGEAHLSPEETAGRSANFLFDELADRLSRGPFKLRVVAQLAAPEDQTSNGTVPWPEHCPVVDLGVITVSSRVADSDAAQRKLIFDPTHLPDGIELSDDPLPAARSAAYAISYKRRNP
jgi:catalase